MTVLNWPSKVNWGQFKKLRTPPRGETLDAHIEGLWANPPGKLYTPKKESDDSWYLTNVDIAVRLNSAKTWVVIGKQTPYLLEHEQGHWDLLGLCVRELHDELVALRAAKPASLAPEVDKITKRITDKAAALDEKYDGETKHSLDKTNQSKWNNLFRAAITSGRNLPDA